MIVGATHASPEIMPAIERYHRRSIRLRGYDYAQAGAYFITLCTHDRSHLFGRIANAVMELNACGEAAQHCWDAIPGHFPLVELDAFQVMPNHVHGIVVITGGNTSRGATHASPLQGAGPNGPMAGSLGAIVGSYRSAVSRMINRSRGTPGEPVWQRNYFERIIRDSAEHGRIAQYIADNPSNWTTDEMNVRIPREG
ncbi:MAG TPA: transposase [Flavobacteriales bacterium]|nr:transposase [Flavobacteriales bacterium]